jgi:hypothetical protein
LEPGEIEDLFGEGWDIERVEEIPDRRHAWFLLSRR